MDELEAHRYGILRRIKKLQSQLAYEGSKEPDEIRDWKAQYNHVISQIEEAQTSSLGGPLENLPVGLWQDIIRECCFNWTGYETSRSHNFEGLFTFTLVS